MSLAEKAKNPPLTENIRCGVGILLSQLQGAELEALKKMLQSPLWSHNALTSALNDEGYSIGQRSVERHRQGVCKCPKN